MGVRGLRFIWESPIAKAWFALGVLLLLLSIAGFGVALNHHSDAKVVEDRLIERGHPVDSDPYELHDARYSASRARGIAFLLLLGAGAALFAGTVAGLPSKSQLGKDPAAQESLVEAKHGRWRRWTRGRALATGLAVTICFVLGLGLWLVGSLRATRFTNSSFLNQSGELRGAVEFIFGSLLLIGAPTTIALLRRTAFWKWAAIIAAVVIGGWSLFSLMSWPPESDWSF